MVNSDLTVMGSRAIKSFVGIWSLNPSFSTFVLEGHCPKKYTKQVAKPTYKEYKYRKIRNLSRSLYFYFVFIFSAAYIRKRLKLSRF